MSKTLSLISVSLISIFSISLLVSRSSTAEKTEYIPVETVDIPEYIRKEAEEIEKKVKNEQ